MPLTTKERINELRAAKGELPPLGYVEIADHSTKPDGSGPYSHQYVKAVLNGRGLPVTDDALAATLDAIETAITKARRAQPAIEDRYGRGFAVAR